jgi:hypothetical protein
MAQRTFQDTVATFVTQTSAWQVRFREPMGFRLFCLFGAALFAGMGILAAGVPTYAGPLMGGTCGAICLWMLYMSLRHEMHLNFHYRTYNEVFGIGPLCRSRQGSFDEILCVYTREDARSDGYGPLYTMGLSFGSTGNHRVSLPYTRPAYDLMGSQNGDAMTQYAQDLAAKMDRPYQQAN